MAVPPSWKSLAHQRSRPEGNQQREQRKSEGVS